ncbi:hypothetical protein AGDE_08775 [Angomonas deanei]|uniref:Sel1 repeat n=2 Tax=Angomonas deanei TaxID=59799 RepID=A0A7G2CIP7_9TRYP|nr:hypothetical protein AGDE_08775 [Angomonas deanei]CAD2218794.1 hypothetical protein, conserved [Angomonas deanei]|eukprot:EPY32273.1 hypothetical protein AGDE_08775 [Angomonas deanei]
MLWPSLIMLPLKEGDELLVSTEELDRMLKSQLPSLPTIADEKKEAAEEGEDLDRLLDEAANEVTKKDENEEELGYGAYIAAELKNFKQEADEIEKALKDVNESLEKGLEGEEETAALKKKKILEEMGRLHDEMRELRTKEGSLANLIQTTTLDIKKGRVNVGLMGDEGEVEEFQSEEEKAMTATELMARGLQAFETQLESTLHFLRLAAIHHNHDTSIVLLYDIYSQIGSPRGAFMLLQRALDDKNISAICNHKLGELYDSGARYFIPLFPAAVHFYQRAAKTGHTNAMLSLAQLWLRGSTETSMLSEDEAEALKDMRKYHAWLDKAADRGAGSALFVKGCMHIRGEHGAVKDYKTAKKYIDGAMGAQPELMKNAAKILLLLEQLRAEEETASNPPSSVTPSTQPSSAQPVAKSLNVDRDPQAFDKAAKRLGTLTQGMTPAQSTTAQRAKPGSAKRKQFWERAAVASVVGYGLYTLAFPIRALLLPFFYDIVSSFTESIM